MIGPLEGLGHGAVVVGDEVKHLVFEAQLFGQGIDHVGPVVEASVRMARHGLGVGRWAAEVREVRELEPFGSGSCALPFRLDRSTLTLVEGWDDAVSRAEALSPGMAALRFLTPTHLVRDHYAVRMPTFPVLARALLRRLTALSGPSGKSFALFQTACGGQSRVVTARIVRCTRSRGRGQSVLDLPDAPLR